VSNQAKEKYEFKRQLFVLITYMGKEERWVKLGLGESNSVSSAKFKFIFV